MAVESDRVTAEVIEVAEFPLVARRYQVYGVPKVVINDRVSFEGALPEPSFVERVVEGAAGRTNP
jgi:predicted DsbA family dithiol-disulfide isomerase